MYPNIARFKRTLVMLLVLISGVLGWVGVTPGATFAQEPTPTPSIPEVPGTVSGTVVNATAGAPVPADLSLELHIIDASMNETIRQTSVAADGTFRFSDVPIRSENTYIVSTHHQTRLFSSEFVKGDPTQPNLILNLTLYDLTDDTSVIQITSFVTQVLADQDGLQVAAMVRLKNTSDRLFVTKEQVSETQFTSIKLILPPGAEIMGFADSSDRFVIGADGRTINDTLPVSPKEEHLIHVVYLIAYNPAGTTLEQTLPYPLVGTAELYARPTSLKVIAEGDGIPFLARGVVDRSGSPYQGFGSSGGLPAAATLRYEFAGTPEVSSSGSSGSTGSVGSTAAQGGGFPRELVVGILVGGGIGLIVVGIGLMARERRLVNRSSTPTAETGVSDPEAELLEAERTALEALYHRGDLTVAEYEARTRALKGTAQSDPESLVLDAELIALDALYQGRKITKKEYEARKNALRRRADGKSR